MSVLLRDGDEAPIVVPLGDLTRAQLERARHVFVQILCWTDTRPPIEVVVVNYVDGIGCRATEEQLARVVDQALAAFEARGRNPRVVDQVLDAFEQGGRDQAAT